MFNKETYEILLKLRYLARCVSVYYPVELVYMLDFFKFLNVVLSAGVQVVEPLQIGELFPFIRQIYDTVKTTRNNSVDSVTPSTDCTCFTDRGHFSLASV